jgi:hydroxyacylglutathione hydrolase
VIVEHLSVGMLACTCTIVADEVTREAIIVDGGDEVDRIAAIVDELGLHVKYLVHTHAHIDHIGALGELRARCGGAGLLHRADLPLYQTLAMQAQWIGLSPVPPVVAIDGDLRDDETLTIGATKVRALHTPGHTPGSTSFALESAEGTAMLLTGDTLFRGSIGRWDMGGTSAEDIVTSIRTKLLPYPDNIPVIPGHGPATTIGHERATNPFLA